MSAAAGPATARRARPAAMRNGRASGQAARELLLDVAEELFGFRGVSAVSTREIAVAAGQGNNSAVQYHFGGKQGLIRALIESRNDVVELGRRELLAASPDPAEATAAELFRILWQPLLELPTRKGHHCFIRFMLAWQIQLGGADHPFVEQPQRYPAWHALMDLLRRCNPALTQARFQSRIVLIAMMFWSAVSEHDHALLAARGGVAPDFDFEDIIGLCVAALLAPVA